MKAEIPLLQPDIKIEIHEHPLTFKVNCLNQKSPLLIRVEYLS